MNGDIELTNDFGGAAVRRPFSDAELKACGGCSLCQPAEVTVIETAEEK